MILFESRNRTLRNPVVRVLLRILRGFFEEDLRHAEEPAPRDPGGFSRERDIYILKREVRVLCRKNYESYPLLILYFLYHKLIKELLRRSYL